MEFVVKPTIKFVVGYCYVCSKKTCGQVCNNNCTIVCAIDCSINK